MNTITRSYDVIAMGRSSIDLYSNNIGAPFVDISSFAAYVGGCPTNICVGTRRLGLRSALFTAVGDDQVGNFILHFLRQEGVETRFTPTKAGRRSSAVVLGIEPPDRFPLTYYRENCADIALTIDDVMATPIADSHVLLITGTGLSKEPSRSATLFAAEVARQAGTAVMLDIDFRPDQWHDARAFGVVLRSALRLVDIVVGTDDEINATILTDASQISLTHSQVSDARVSGDTNTAIQALLDLGPRVLAHKRGAAGSTVHFVSNGDVAAQIEPGLEFAPPEFRKSVAEEVRSVLDGIYSTHGHAAWKKKLMINDRIADSIFQQVVTRADEYTVLATPNLNGDYISDACAAQVGGLGIAPGANIGDGYAIFEATHGTAPKYADKDVINPGSVILSGVMMFRFLGWSEAADLILKGDTDLIDARTDAPLSISGASCGRFAAFGSRVAATTSTA